jgi:hypothetical protein
MASLDPSNVTMSSALKTGTPVSIMPIPRAPGDVSIMPVPETPTTTNPGTTPPATKIATPDLVIIKDELLPVDTMTDLVFENIGGHELINVSRHDLVNGIDVLYQPIKNLSTLYLQYNPENILRLQDTTQSYFKNFPIQYSNKIPNVGTGSNGETVYIEAGTGDLIINVINLAKGEQVEVQVLTQGEVFDDTIYGGV